MSNSLNFNGAFQLDRKLTKKATKLLNALYDGDDNVKKAMNKGGDIPTGPCKWVPTSDRCGLQLEANENFFDHVEWLDFIIVVILKPERYVLNGWLFWWSPNGKSQSGIIRVNDNELNADQMKVLSIVPAGSSN